MANNIVKSLLNSVWGGRFSTTDRSLPLSADPNYPDIFFNSYWNTSPTFNDYGRDKDKLAAIFTNPALLKVFCLQCDLFSLGQVYVYKNDIEQKDDPVLRLLDKPNPMQSCTQFLWDLMFWNMVGNDYCYLHSELVERDDNKLYFLNPGQMEWPEDFIKKKDKLVFSLSSEKDLKKTIITYRYEDGSSTTFPLSQLICLPDLTNGNGNWFKGNSRIDALYKIISNSEEALDAANINLNYSKKFMVSGQADPKDVTQLPLSNDEKQDIETKMNGRKKVHAVKSMIDIKRFVSDMRVLELGKAYLEAYFLIGSMYNIPRDVLEAYNSSTYENQEKATAKHVSYTLQPKGNDFFKELGRRFGYDKQGKEIFIDWSHLPFMQVFEKDRAVTKNMQMQTMMAMLKMGIDIKEINEFLDTNFKAAKYEQPKGNTGNPGA